MLLAPSGKGRKRQKKGEKGRFRPISRKGGQTPLKPPFVTPPSAAAQIPSLSIFRTIRLLPFSGGCGFFAYSWKLPAYSGAFLLTADNFSFFAYSWSFSAYSYSFYTYSWSFCAHTRKVRLVGALRDCK